MNYAQFARLSPAKPAPTNPRRIVLILPCCIGDVVLATAALEALRRGYSDAHITWAVGSWSKQVVEHHDLLDAVLDTGPDALPVRTPGGLFRFVRQLRRGNFDLAVSLVRSPLMSVALLLSGIQHRAGLDSDGRGFGYTVRAPIDPAVPRHEAEIYLDVARALGLDTRDCWANVPIAETQAIDAPYVIVNPAGGHNPGMVMDVKRWPPEQFAALANRLSARYQANVIVIGGADDRVLVEAVRSDLTAPGATFSGWNSLSFSEIGALARGALVYIGNDTGLTHYAAAAGARAVMILGPTDPRRYAPFTPDSIALWKPTPLNAGGVAAGPPPDWDWARDGIDVDEAEQQIVDFLERVNP